MECIIGIDAGATKSELIAYDLGGKIIYKNIGDYGNPAVNFDKTVDNICSLIDKSMKDLQNYKCRFMAIGIAGIGTGNYKELIEEKLDERFSIDKVILSDCELAAKAYLGLEDGILVIAGTGSVSFAQKDNKGEIIGGWGHLLGDEGSGYHTVIQAFRRITSQIDNNLVLDNLSQRLMKEIDAIDSSGIKKYIYGQEKNKIASLFPIIVELSKKGEEGAVKLLEDAGKYLAEETKRAYRKLEFTDKVTIGLKGGVFHNSEIVLNSYEDTLKNYIEEFHLIKKDISATEAVLNIFN